jgi:hypothetical protein
VDKKKAPAQRRDGSLLELLQTALDSNKEHLQGSRSTATMKPPERMRPIKPMEEVEQDQTCIPTYQRADDVDLSLSGTWLRKQYPVTKQGHRSEKRQNSEDKDHVAHETLH